MDKQLYDQITDSLRQAVAIRRGELAPSRVFVFDTVTGERRQLNRVTVVRRTTGLSQAAFAALLGVQVRTVRSWESGQHAPRGPASVLIELLARAPKLVLQTLRGRV
jgi:putative transcriptional regulator